MAQAPTALLKELPRNISLTADFVGRQALAFRLRKDYLGIEAGFPSKSSEGCDKDNGVM